VPPAEDPAVDDVTARPGRTATSVTRNGSVARLAPLAIYAQAYGDPPRARETKPSELRAEADALIATYMTIGADQRPQSRVKSSVPVAGSRRSLSI